MVNAAEEGILIAAMVEGLEDAGEAVLTINVATELVDGIGIGKYTPLVKAGPPVVAPPLIPIGAPDVAMLGTRRRSEISWEIISLVAAVMDTSAGARDLGGALDPSTVKSNVACWEFLRIKTKEKSLKKNGEAQKEKKTSKTRPDTRHKMLLFTFENNTGHTDGRTAHLKTFKKIR